MRADKWATAKKTAYPEPRLLQEVGVLKEDLFVSLELGGRVLILWLSIANYSLSRPQYFKHRLSANSPPQKHYKHRANRRQKFDWSYLFWQFIKIPFGIN
jgi:hypothetical protein